MIHKNSERGATLILILVAAGFMTLVGSFLVTKVIQGRKLSQDQQGLFRARTLAHSIADYTLYGLKNRWCFTEVWTRDMSCGIDHERNSERLIIPMQTIENMKKSLEAMNIAAPDPLHLNSIGTTLDMSTVTAAHPLYRIMNLSTPGAFSSVKITIKRSESIKAKMGNETYLTIRVELIRAENQILKLNENPYVEVTSAFFPREVNTFGLVIANDLRLDLTGPPTEKGDVGFPLSEVSCEQLKSKGTIEFVSPIYVNGSVHLPKKGKSSCQRAHFNDKVYMGNGGLLQNGNPYRPETAGGFEDQKTKSLGFQKGVEADGDRDIGLDYLAGIQSSGSIDTSAMKYCIKLNQIKYSLPLTADSSLVIKSVGTNIYRLGLSNYNQFMPQSGLDAGIVPAHRLGLYGGQPEDEYKQTELYANPVLKFNFSLESDTISVGPDFPSFIFGGHTFEAHLARDSQLSIRPIQTGQGDLIRTSVKSGQDQLDYLVKQIAELKKDPKKAADLLKAQNDYARLLPQVDKLKILEDRWTQIEKNPPEIKFELQSYKIGSPIDVSPPFEGAEPNQLTLKYEIKNQNQLITKPTINLTGYDVSYMGGVSFRKLNSANQKAGYSTQGSFTYKALGSGISASVGPDFMIGSLYQQADPSSKVAVVNAPDDLEFYGAKENACFNTQFGKAKAFPEADWRAADLFAAGSRNSWNFTNVNAENELIISGLNAGGNQDPLRNSFIIKALYPKCTIKPDAEYVSGFFVCDELVIDARVKPLYISGTFIISKLKLDPSAIDAGIRWGSIYNPQNIVDMKMNYVLTTSDKKLCPSVPEFDVPAWHPYPGQLGISESYYCTAGYLRERAQPFSWTTVNPDCGVLPGATSTSCKNYPTRFIIREIYRRSNF